MVDPSAACSSVPLWLDEATVQLSRGRAASTTTGLYKEAELLFQNKTLYSSWLVNIALTTTTMGFFESPILLLL